MTDKRFRYGIIGTGREHGTEGATGFGMANAHITAFKTTEKADLVAIADIREDNARLFLDRHESDAKHYSDYHAMLEQEALDIVSICTWPHLHSEMTIAACEAGVKAVYCEKPMATTWGDAKRMKAAADKRGTILIFNHQRRFLQPFQDAKRLLKEGVIGKLERLEAECGDMFDWGTHWLDMLFFFNDETPAEWVIAQIDSRKERRVFGALMEDQAICHFKFTNGVRGLIVSGYEAYLGAAIRLAGTEGAIEIVWGDPCLRVRGKDDMEWRIIDQPEGIHSFVAIDRAAEDLIQALEQPGHKPLLSADHAIQSTEVIFATYESSRWRGRIDLPLQPEDSALLSMVAEGAIGPNRM